MKFDKIQQMVSKDMLIDLYINQQLPKDIIAKQLNICLNSLDKLLKEYNIKREDIRKGRTIKSKQNTFDCILNQLPKDLFNNLYLEQNLPRTYFQEKYNLSSYILDRIISYYDLHKSKNQSSKLGLDSKYNKFGSKENYEKHSLEKRIATLISKYGSIEEAFKQRAIKCKQTKISRYGISNPYNVEKFKQTCLAKYGVEYPCLRKEAKLKGNNSKPNQAFEKLLNSNNIEFEREFVLESKAFDFKVGDILIEINPSFTHNSTIGIYGKQGISKDYHYLKSQLAFKNNFRCIHVWDWDNIDKILAQLKLREALYARKCIIKSISKQDASRYLNKYHLQGYSKSDIHYGLFNNSELVMVMTFGKPRYNKKFEYELIRLCSHKYIIGGAEKLFKHFIKEYQPNSIISYCDFSKFKGDIYQKLGMKLISTSIGKHWYNSKFRIHITDNLLRQRGFDQLLGNIFGYFGKGSSNEYLMKKFNFLEIFDSGQGTYIWNK